MHEQGPYGLLSPKMRARFTTVRIVNNLMTHDMVAHITSVVACGEQPDLDFACAFVH